ncbi:MAG: AtpZ/AtpI family protein [Alphaproteobacteria bacterium]|nr:AtpZ/AtpI family protein [Alphaproteobacteria bacterium]
MAEDKPDDLARLEARLKAAQEARRDPSAGGEGPRPSMTGAGFALRAGVEMAACVGVGAGMGYGLDLVFDTRPWLLVVFLVVGGAAGIMTVMRLAGRMEPGAWEGGPK